MKHIHNKNNYFATWSPQMYCLWKPNFSLIFWWNINKIFCWYCIKVSLCVTAWHMHFIRLHHVESWIMVWILHQNKFLNFLNPSNNTNNDMRFCYFNIDLRVFLEFFLSDEHINNQNCSRSFFKKIIYIRKIKNLCIITLHPWSLYFEHRINWSNIPYFIRYNIWQCSVLNLGP